MLNKDKKEKLGLKLGFLGCFYCGFHCLFLKSATQKHTLTLPSSSSSGLSTSLPHIASSPPDPAVLCSVSDPIELLPCFHSISVEFTFWSF